MQKSFLQSAAFLSLTLAATLPLAATAGVITWGAPTNTATVTDVVTTGTQVAGVNVTAPATGSLVVNGQTFNNTTDIGPTPLSWYGFSGTLDSGTTGDANYDALLNTAALEYVNNPTATVILSNLLIANSEYLVQVWYTDTRALSAGRTMSIDNVATLSGEGTDVDERFGQWVIGTFIADGTTQTMLVDGINAGGYAQINAFQVRQIGVRPVPAPAPIALMAVGGLGLLFSKRRKTA